MPEDQNSTQSPQWQESQPTSQPPSQPLSQQAAQAQQQPSAATGSSASSFPPMDMDATTQIPLVRRPEAVDNETPGAVGSGSFDFWNKGKQETHDAQRGSDATQGHTPMQSAQSQAHTNSAMPQMPNLNPSGEIPPIPPAPYASTPRPQGFPGQTTGQQVQSGQAQLLPQRQEHQQPGRTGQAQQLPPTVTAPSGSYNQVTQSPMQSPAQSPYRPEGDQLTGRPQGGQLTGAAQGNSPQGNSQPNNSVPRPPQGDETLIIRLPQFLRKKKAPEAGPVIPETHKGARYVIYAIAGLITLGLVGGVLYMMGG